MIVAAEILRCNAGTRVHDQYENSSKAETACGCVSREVAAAFER